MSTSHSPRTDAPRPSGWSRFANWIPGLIVVLGFVEIALLILIGVKTSLWWSLLIIVLGWVVGFALVVAAGQQSFTRLRSLFRAVRGRGDVQDHLSRPAFTLLAALFFFFPGLLTDVIGIILLLTPVQRRAVRSTGLASGSETARRVLYRRSNGGVIDGEIIVDAEPVRRHDAAHGEGGRGAEQRRDDEPPLILPPQ